MRNLSPNFAIPAGTQVVLVNNYQDRANGLRKKSGTVGVVVKCPPSNDKPYIVRFSNESEMNVPFENLTMRRREIENILSGTKHDVEYKRHLLYRCQVGSHAFGLDNENPDTDIRGIFLPPAQDHWSMFEVPKQIEFQDGGN